MKPKKLFLEFSVVLFAVFILLWIFVPKFVRSQNINTSYYFPDEVVRRAVEKALGVKEDEPFSRKQAKEYTGFLYLERNESLKGIELLPNLTILSFASFTIKDVDLSIFSKLNLLTIVVPNLQKINISDCSNLKDFRFMVGSKGNKLNQEIDFLFPKQNRIEILHITNAVINDLSIFTNLKELAFVNGLQHIPGTGLKAIDVSQNKYLEILDVKGNHLKELDLSNNPNLRELYCANNQIQAITFAERTNLEKFEGSGNQLTGLDLTHTNKLNRINLENNPIQEIKLKGNRELKEIHVQEWGLSQATLQHIQDLELSIISPIKSN